jgi:hypothetical protein
MVRNVHGVSCPWGGMSWGELSMERVVHGASCPWGQLSMGRVVYGASCMWGKTNVRRNFMGRVLMKRVSSFPWGEFRWGELSGNLRRTWKKVMWCGTYISSRIFSCLFPDYPIRIVRLSSLLWSVAFCSFISTTGIRFDLTQISSNSSEEGVTHVRPCQKKRWLVQFCICTNGCLMFCMGLGC